MMQIISGVIAAASSIEPVKKKDGTTTSKAVLRIQDPTDTQHPHEVAIVVTGVLAKFAGMVGRNVSVEYVNRVYAIEHDGKTTYRNEPFARNIQLLPSTYCFTLKNATK